MVVHIFDVLPPSLKPVTALPQTLFEICLGVLLGDASLQRNTSKSSVKHRISFPQGAWHNHKPYVWHLYHCFSGYVGARPYHNKIRKTLAFCTFFNKQFNCLAPILFEKGNKKSIGTYLLREKLSVITLAYGFMDDGGLLSYNNCRALVFNWQAFTGKECHILRDNLKQTYNLNSWCKADKPAYFIVVPARCCDYLRFLITPHIIDSMEHKLRGEMKGRARKKHKVTHKSGYNNAPLGLAT